MAWTAGVLLLLVGGVAAAMIYHAGQRGSNSVEQWVARRVVVVAQNYLWPRLEFSSLDYQYPRTVVLREVRLVADGVAGEREVVVAEVGELVIELAEVPRKGQPLRIARLELTRPRLSLVAHRGGGLVGFNPLLRPSETPAKRPPDQPPVKLSEAFVATRIEVIDGRIAYQSADPAEAPFHLDAIHTTLSIDPEDGDRYRLDVRLNRGSAFDLALTADLLPDDQRIEIETLRLDAVIDEQVLEGLPPRVQSLIQRYGVTGKLSLEASGKINLADVDQSIVSAQLRLDDAGLVLVGKHWSVDHLVAIGELVSGELRLRSLLAQALGGEIEAKGKVRFNDRLDAELDFLAKDIDLAMIDEQYAGRFSAQGHLTEQLIAPGQRLGGSAEFSVRSGRLTNLPLLKELGGLMDIVTQGDGRDTADGKIVFINDRLYLEELTYQSDAVAARGRGNLHTDGRLDLLLRAGTLEKAEQLFILGDLLAATSDLVLPLYRVGGTLGSSEVSLTPPGAELVTPYEPVPEGGEKVERGPSAGGRP